MKWPEFLEKKEKLFSPRTTATEARAWGDKYLEAGRFHDAVAFYTKAGYQQGLARVIEMAVEAGDFQLLEEMRAAEARGGIARGHQEPWRCRACGYRDVCDQRLEGPSGGY